MSSAVAEQPDALMTAPELLAGNEVAPELRAAIVAAYRAREGGYQTLGTRFGVSKTVVKRSVRAAGIVPNVSDIPAVAIHGVEQHARDRLLERFGLSPSRAEWRAAYQHVSSGRALLVRRHIEGSQASEVYAVRLAGHEVFVAYSPRLRRILTVLPNGRASRRGR